MNEYIWIFPVLFIFHEFEEIIGFGEWYKRKGDVMKVKYPKVAKMFEKIFNDYSTEGMALAVLEELLLCVVVCIFSLYDQSFYLWIGIFVAFILHMVMHIGQSVMFGGYVPSLITSIIEIPVCIIVVNKCITITHLCTREIFIWSIVGLAIIGINVKIAHYLMHQFTKWINR